MRDLIISANLSSAKHDGAYSAAYSFEFVVFDFMCKKYRFPHIVFTPYLQAVILLFSRQYSFSLFTKTNAQKLFC